MQIIESFRNCFKIPELRTRILITLGLLIVYRLGSHVSAPGVNPEAVQRFQQKMTEVGGSLFGMMQVFSGSALGNLALFSLGIMPYITASIIMQLMTKVSPTLEEMVKQGASGQRKIGQYTRFLTIPICLVQGFFMVSTLRSFRDENWVLSYGFGSAISMMLSFSAGAVFIMWLGEQISEHGIGNGASVLIMSGIVARLPGVAQELLRLARGGSVQTSHLLLITALYVGTIFAVVFITQAQRRIPIQNPKHFRGRRMVTSTRNYLPIKVNTAGVMPVIFASSLMVIPSVLAMIPGLKGIEDIFARGWFLYTVFNIVMIFFFSYFWTYLFFQPQELSNNLKEFGSFIPGIRPGENTAAYLNVILSRITLCGAAFLCAIALIPDLVTAAMGGQIQRQLLSFLGGTGILIVVGVGLDVIQKIESYLLMHHYSGFVGTSGIRGRR